MKPVRAMLVPAFALFLLGAAPDSYSRDELDRLQAEKRAAEQRLAALETAQGFAGSDLDEIDSKLIAAALESKRREEQASLAERRLIDLETRRIAARASLMQDRANLDDLLGALAVSSSKRPPALVVNPNDASDAIRASIVMGVMAPAIKTRTDALRAEIETLERLERETRRERARLETAEAVLAEKSVEIEQLAAAKRSRFEDLSGEAEALRVEVASLAKRAGSLEQLLTGLEKIAPDAPRTKPRPPTRQYASLGPTPRASEPARPDLVLSARPLDGTALGGMQKPASGMLIRRFGEKTESGAKAEGMTIMTRERAQVVAPVDGTIAFAGEFRTYGNMLILRTSDGYHVILSGMSQVYGAKEQWVTAGEPVGRMPDRVSPAPELEVEVRKDGKALDPSKWLKVG